MKRALIYVDEADTEKRRKIEKSGSNVLATYPDYMLVEADEDQINSLESQELRVEEQEGPRMIKLRAVEFDTSEEAPSPPPALSLSAAEISRESKNYWIVQSVGPLKAEWGEEIRALGGKLHNYIPENAFLVDMTLQTKEKVEKLPFVNWVGLYQPSYKISPLLMGRKKKASPSELRTLSISTEVFKPAPEGNISVILHDPADLRKVSQRIEKLGGTVVATGKDVIRTSLDLSEVDRVAKMVEVKWIEPYTMPRLFNDKAAEIIGVQPVWDNHGLDGEGQIVAVADTGLDTGKNDNRMHSDFKGRILKIYDRAGEGADDTKYGHGTHVVGSVLGNGSRSNGTIKGMAFGARLVFQAIEDENDCNPDNPNECKLSGIPTDYNQLFQQAYDDGARIHNNSWGSIRSWAGPMRPATTGDLRTGIECGCEEVGTWPGPDSPKRPAVIQDPNDQSKGHSPNGKYELTAIADPVGYPAGYVHLTIKRGNTTVLNEAFPAGGWGFSPDDDRFVVWYIIQHVHITRNDLHLYDLASEEPDEVVWRMGASSGGTASIGFSGHGKYLFYAAVNYQDKLDLNVVDTVSGEVVHNLLVFLHNPPNEVDIAGWGFSPDAQDATFITAWLSALNVATLQVVRLTTSEVLLQSDFIEANVAWLFSPCGDLFALADRGTEDIRVYATLDGADKAIGSIFHNGRGYDRIETTNDQHQVVYNDGSILELLVNTARQDCPDGNGGDSLEGEYTAASQDIDEFMWNHKDMIILFAAGNSGRDTDQDGVIDPDSLSVEASAKNCISVGASENNRATGGLNPGGDCNTYGDCWPDKFPTNPIRDDRLSDNPEGMAAFSSRGPTNDGRIKPDVVAPGTNILSVRSSKATGQGWGFLPAGDPNRDHYIYMGGTSMATPLTAGTVALIRQYLMRVCLHNNPSAALLKAILIHGATPLAGQYAPSEVGGVPDNNQGWGRVNLGGSLFPDYPVSIEFKDDPADALGTREDKEFRFKVVNDTVPFKATLVWTDYPSEPATGGVLVNTLRLSVTAPNGTTVQGVPPNNNVQQVVINNPQTGAYKARVEGIKIATQAMTGKKKQDFALVVSGGLEFIDVYIKDNPADHGVPPSKGCLYRSPDIWVSLDNDPTSPPAANPEHGQTNYVFVRVHNRGSKSANNSEVTLHWAKGGTNLSRPHWKTDGIKVDGVAGNVRQVSVPAHTAAGDGEAITAAFEWTPPDPKDYTIEPGHFCLFATVSHIEDPLLQEDVDAVRWEDNLAWKNVTVKDLLLNTATSMEFYISGVEGQSSTADLRIDRSALPAGGSVKLKIRTRFLEDSAMVNLQKVWESKGGRVCRVEVTSDNTADLIGMSLKPDDNTLVRLDVTLPENAVEGEVYPIFVEQKVNGNLTGRVTLVARTVGTPAYIANRNPRSRELHLANCRWASKIAKWNKVPYNDLETALRRGYDGCKYCLPEHHTR